MKPVLIDLGGLELTSYGVSKALAAFVAALMLGRAFRERGRDPHDAHTLVIWSTLAGFVGAKLYYIAEHGGDSIHGIGTGFTWFGGFIGGALTAILIARRQGLSMTSIAAMTAAPLAVAYGVGRLGCLLAGDGTYGEPSSLPWAMSFPDGTVPTTDRVHPTPLYEAIAAFAFGALLWRLRNRLTDPALFALYAVLTGAARFLVEIVRINPDVALGMSGPQLWSVALLLGGVALGLVAARRGPGLLAGKRPLPA